MGQSRKSLLWVIQEHGGRLFGHTTANCWTWMPQVTEHMVGPEVHRKAAEKCFQINKIRGWSHKKILGPFSWCFILWCQRKRTLKWTHEAAICWIRLWVVSIVYANWQPLSGLFDTSHNFVGGISNKSVFMTELINSRDFSKGLNHSVIQEAPKDSCQRLVRYVQEIDIHGYTFSSNKSCIFPFDICAIFLSWRMKQLYPN